MLSQGERGIGCANEVWKQPEPQKVKREISQQGNNNQQWTTFAPLANKVNREEAARKHLSVVCNCSTPRGHFTSTNLLL